MIERLDDPRTRNERPKYLAGVFATQIDCLDTKGGKRIAWVFRVGRVRIKENEGVSPVDHNPAVPTGRPVSAFSTSTQRTATTTMSALAASGTVPALSEWDGPAALPPPTAFRVRPGGLSGGAQSCLARPTFTQ
jgi:hypothetical protein